jgi:putative GTP pyrophosphokinase
MGAMDAKSQFAPLPGISRSAIDRAGEELRRYLLEEDEPTETTVEAFDTMIAFRETFQMPLNKTVLGLRSMVRSERPELKETGSRIPVVQRLKRREQIINKLVRLEGSMLSNMGDIGGCRAILAERRQVDGVVRRIRKNWQVHGKIRDTRDEAAPSGYRAVHVIVVRDGRRIEIQLRDPREQEWALAVERTGTRLGIGLKEGEGPADLREYFRLASLGMYRDSLGLEADPAFKEQFAEMREQVRPYFKTGR